MNMVKRVSRRQRSTLALEAALPILSTGHIFFRSIQGSIADNLDILRDSWQDDEVRDAVYAEPRHNRPRPFAEFLFGADGRKPALTAEDVSEAYREYFAQ